MNAKERNSMVGQPMSPFKKAMAIIAGVTALVGAATPGIMGMVDNTDNRAEATAIESAEKALEATEKAELAYRLLAQEVNHLRVDNEQQQDDTAQLRRFLMETVLTKMTTMSNERPVPSSRPRVRPRAVSVEDLFSDDELAMLADPDEADEEGEADSSLMGIRGGTGSGAGYGSGGGSLGVLLATEDDMEPPMAQAVQADLPPSLDEAWKAQAK